MFEFLVNLNGSSLNCQCAYLCLKYNFSRAHKKEPRAVETLPWQCQLTEPNDAKLVDQRTVCGVSLIENYLGKAKPKNTPSSNKRKPKTASQRTYRPLMMACSCFHVTVSLKG